MTTEQVIRLTFFYRVIQPELEFRTWNCKEDIQCTTTRMGGWKIFGRTGAEAGRFETLNQCPLALKEGMRGNHFARLLFGKPVRDLPKPQFQK